MTPASYADELARVHAERPGIRVAVYDHAFEGKRAWYRFEFRWRDRETDEPRTQAGWQCYRIEGGKLAETWIALMPIGSTWPDPIAQETWTSTPPRFSPLVDRDLQAGSSVMRRCPAWVPPNESI